MKKRILKKRLLRKRLLKKIISKILLITITASSFLPYGIINKSYAQTNTWDFSIPGDYTVSDTAKIDISNGIGSLKYVMTHQSSLVNGGSVLLNGAFGIVIEGNYAYMSAKKSDAIEIVDISNPLIPVHASSISDGAGGALLNGPRGIVKSGNFLYVASYLDNAIEIIDVSDPLNPVHASSIQDGRPSYLRRPNGLFKNGNYLYVASIKDDAIEVIDVTNPLSPTHHGAIRSKSRLNGAHNVFVSGNYAYVTSNIDDSMQVINISNPASPSFAAELTNGAGGALLDGAYGIKIDGNYAYISSNANNALEIVDITNPLTPTHHSSISDGGTTLLGAPRGLIVDGNYTFVASSSSDAIEVVDTTTPSSPTHLSSIVNGGTTLLNGASDITKSGSLLYVASNISDALEIIKAEYPIDSPNIEPVLSQSYHGNITSLTETLGVNNAGNITYQISKDGGTTWYYYNGSSWVSTINGVIDSNPISLLNTNISTFNNVVGPNNFKWKAYLNSNGNQKVELDMIQLNTLTPNSIINPVFHFDGYDINGNGNYLDEPADGTYINTWVDKFNTYNATQAVNLNAPIYTSSTIKPYSQVGYGGKEDYQTIGNQIDINTGIYSEKSFATVIKTGEDINSLQNVYKQGDSSRGYAIQIENGNLYIGAWNNVEWLSGDQYKTISKVVEANTEYNIIIIQDSTDILANNTLKLYVNGTLEGTLNNIGIQAAHTGSVSIGRVSSSAIKLSDNSSITTGYYFNGKIGELISWNHILSPTEITGINKYFDDRWFIGPFINYVYPTINATVDAGDFDINIAYDDSNSGSIIDTNTDVIELHRWNGTDWGLDISGTYIDTVGKTITNLDVIYPVNAITAGKYKLIFTIANLDTNSSTKEFLFNVGETTPSSVQNIIYHYDGQDTNGDSIINNEGNLNGDSIGTLTDKINTYNAYQLNITKTPTYQTNSLNGYPSINFSGSTIYDIDNQALINTQANFQEKSFATIIKTGNDINTFQTLYEQGDSTKGYNLMIENGNMYAGIWNTVDWDTGHQYKTTNLGAISTNTVYNIIIVQSSISNLTSENSIKFYLDGSLINTVYQVDSQTTHNGGIALGGVVNDTRKTSNNSAVSITEGNYFIGNIGEFISWNHALDIAEINGIQKYFSNKWGAVVFTENVPVSTPTTNKNPEYRFETNTSGTLTYSGSCNSVTSNAFVGVNIINFDSDGAGGPLADGLYDDCSILLLDSFSFTHTLNVTAFTVETQTYTLVEVTPIPLFGTDKSPDYTFNSPITGTITYSGACNSNTTTAVIGDNTVTMNNLAVGNYPDCSISVSNGTQSSEILMISEFNIVTKPPLLDSKTISENQLFPIGDFDFEYAYHAQPGTAIDLTSENVSLYKYDSGTGSYGPDIAGTYISNLSVSATLATYQSVGLPFGKYKVSFTIKNTDGTPMQDDTIIYVDAPEFIISSGSLDMGTLSTVSNTFTPEITVTVKTVGAGFDVLLNKTSNMLNGGGDQIINWDGSLGIGYEGDPFTNSISTINPDEIILNQTGSINTNGEKNTYSYKIKIGSLIDEQQSAGNYQGNFSLGIDLSY